MRPSELAPERWRRVDAILDAALDAGPGARGAVITRACGDDVALRAEVQALLEAHEQETTILDAPASLIGAAIVAEQDLEATRDLGPFRVIREIGRGAMGVVYLADDTRVGRRVALKLLPSYVGESEPAKRRFLTEARAAAALDHPGIATVYESDTTPDGQAYIAFAYYEGRTLDARIAEGRLPLADAVTLAIRVAEGLSAAHGKGIIHRDVKPSNVLLTADGKVKLLDFGVAKFLGEDQTAEGIRIGTVAYMSPEQAKGAAIDGRADLWALGVMFHEMVTGERPFRGESAELLIHAILYAAPVSIRAARDEVPSSVARVVEKLLAKAPGERYQSADDLLLDLRALSTGARPPVVTRHPPRTAVPRRWRRLVVLAVLALAAALWVGWWDRQGSTSSEVGEPSSGDPEAVDAYQLGLVHLAQRDAAGMQMAARYFSFAIARDSSFAPAYAALAETRGSAAYFGSLRPAVVMPEVRALAQAALRHDSLLAEGHVALAHLHLYWDWDWEAAERRAIRALALDSTLPTAYNVLSEVLAVTGRPTEALEAAKRGQALQRRVPFSVFRPVVVRYYLRDWDEAIAEAREGLSFFSDFWQGHWLLCIALAGKGRHDEAVSSCERAAAQSGRTAMALGGLALAYGLAGRRGDALAVASELEARAESTYVSGAYVGVAYGAAGERDRAFAWLDRAYEERDIPLIYAGVSILFDPIRQDPRFGPLARRIGVVSTTTGTPR